MSVKNTEKLPETIEILSPGKNLFYSKEAIKCGADAIYIGASKFSLRYQQGNTLDDIRELVEYAHKYWVKIYIPINCLLFTDEDVKEIKEMINAFYEMGVDGLIIQDIGILELDLPPIPIILSTNTGCYTKDDAKFFEKCGVSRIVLPRELSYNEIKDITDNSNIKIETFCYGYLCVGYSGNCYLAYVENLLRSKSADTAHYKASNFGVCPERCMGNWTLKDADGNVIRENDRLFNIKYLNLANEIGRLVDIGVDSFKIAGREKDLKHVKNSTAMFSKIANQVVKEKNIRRSSSGRTILGFEPDFSKNFNKGFTDFFFNGRKCEMYSKYHLVGVLAGTVKDFNGNSFILENKQFELHKGDKLRYKIGENQVKTIEIVDVKENRYFTNETTDDLNGLELFRYINEEGFKEVENSVNYRVISVNISIEENEKTYLVKAIDEDENTISVNVEKTNSKRSCDEVLKELQVLDEDCEFFGEKIDFAGKELSVDMKVFKDEVFGELRKERAKNRPVDRCQVVKNDYPYYKKELTYLANVTNKYTKAFFERHGVEKIEPALESCENLDDKRVFSSRYCLRYELGYCSKAHKSDVPPMPWKLEQLENGNKFKVEFDCKKCSMYLYIEGDNR